MASEKIFVVVSLMHKADIPLLKRNVDDYLSSVRGKVFLERDYGGEDTVGSLELILSSYTKLLETAPLEESPLLFPYSEYDIALYKTPIELGNIPFTIMLVGISEGKITEKHIVGDVWLGPLYEDEKVCFKGTTERTTFVGPSYQSVGVGQIAVSSLYESLVEKWIGHRVKFINYSGYSESHYLYDGVVSYVDVKNIQSIGNNHKSGNILIGMDKGMLIYRKPNPALRCTSESVVESFSLSSDREVFLRLKDNEQYLYYSEAASQKLVATGIAGVTRESFTATPLYQDSYAAIKEFERPITPNLSLK